MGYRWAASLRPLGSHRRPQFWNPSRRVGPPWYPTPEAAGDIDVGVCRQCAAKRLSLGRASGERQNDGVGQVINDCGLDQGVSALPV